MEKKAKRLCQEFGARIKDARIRRRFTIKEMAKKVGTSERSYIRLESGEPTVGLIHYVKASLILDLDFAKNWQEVLENQNKKVRMQSKIDPDEVDF